MGLFTKKDPCAICGGKVKAIFPWKIDGQLVCNDCHGVTDLPDGVENRMSVEDFREYMTFREENSERKAQFEVSKKIDFGWLDTKFLFDYKNQYFCMDKNLGKTIFEGKYVRSFVIREDDSPLFEGDANGLRCYVSTAPDRARELGPQLDHYRMQLELERERERLRRERGDDSYHPGIMFDIPEPFKQFVIEIQLEGHPYWDFFQADMGGPTFDNSNPYVEDYLNSYEEKAKVMGDLARSFMKIAFPGAPETVVNNAFGGSGMSAAPGANTAGAPVDTVEEIQRYKALMDQGVLSEEEFNAKKRQLLGI